MKEQTYKYIWENAFMIAVRNVDSQISDALKDEYQLSYEKNLNEKKKNVLVNYEKYRDMIKSKYFNSGDQKENLMDIHKVAACFTLAVMDVRVFDYNQVEDIDIDIIYTNYSLAFEVSVNIIYLCMLSDYLLDNDMKKIEILLSQKGMVFPETNRGHDSYVLGRVKTLALNDIYGNDFDILTYADMLFWIERYNKDYIEQRCSGEPY